MPNWLVKTTWTEDEVAATEQWAVNADTVLEAIKQVTTYVHFQPHHVEANLLSSDDDKALGTSDLQPGKVRRVPPPPQ
jgi:hypothetical protein